MNKLLVLAVVAGKITIFIVICQYFAMFFAFVNKIWLRGLYL